VEAAVAVLVTIHQPEHLPWAGYFSKADVADAMVILDVVQYRKNYFQNRNRVLGPNGPTWVVVPVLTKGHTSSELRHLQINDGDRRWRDKYWRTLEMSYARHLHFDEHASWIRSWLDERWDLLVPLNVTLIRGLFEALGITTPLRFASEMPAPVTEGLSGSSLLLSICRALGADGYLSGLHGKEYLDEDLFREAGISVAYHAFTQPEYPQRRQDTFVPGMSVVDLLFNRGPESIECIRRGGRVERGG
jgi:hypothetical protein